MTIKTNGPKSSVMIRRARPSIVISLLVQLQFTLLLHPVHALLLPPPPPPHRTRINLRTTTVRVTASSGPRGDAMSSTGRRITGRRSRTATVSQQRQREEGGSSVKEKVQLPFDARALVEEQNPNEDAYQRWISRRRRISHPSVHHLLKRKVLRSVEHKVVLLRWWRFPIRISSLTPLTTYLDQSWVSPVDLRRTVNSERRCAVAYGRTCSGRLPHTRGCPRRQPLLCFNQTHRCRARGYVGGRVEWLDSRKSCVMH